MAQTTAQISMKDGKVEISANGSSWTDISGFATAISIDGGERGIGEGYTFDGDTAVLTTGKRSPVTITVSALYTEGNSDPFETLLPIHEAGTAYYVRCSPKGGQTGERVFTSGAGYFQKVMYPQGEAGSPDPVVCEFEFVCSALTASDVA